MPMQKLFRMFFLPIVRMPFPATYSVRSQFQWDWTASLPCAAPLWQEMQAAVTCLRLVEGLLAARQSGCDPPRAARVADSEL